MGIFSSVASSIGGAIAGGVGNYLGAKSANKALDDQIEYMEEAEQRAREEREAGKKAALANIAPYMDGQAARNYIGGVMTSRPDILTDSDRLLLEDINRDVTAGLAASGMRGAGRGGQAVRADALRRARAQIFDRNQARADLAAASLNQQGEQAAANAANINTGTAGANASDIVRVGGAVGNAYGQQGLNTGNAWTSSANLAAQTLGAIAAYGADDSKKLKSYPVLSGQV